ncbi:LysR family transcriptional regulator [Amycolatopsis anabasis]|uniref:LysR family transcriptional regulator n=1 Tax=Amycolatopsis anabasis TaxID=1840409 RepID=UPI001FE7D561|nr:LysR family transcriptional regulator [Amycolatopsis anabasis]
MHQLRIFLSLAEELHFGRAAARMFMSQPALSRQLSALERRLGVELVARTNRSVELTPAGRAILPEARAALDAMRKLHRAVEGHTRSATGKVVIGTIGAESAMTHTHRVLAELRLKNPNLSVEVRLLNVVEHFLSLFTGEVDVVFCRPPAPAEIQTHHLATEPRVVCLSADDPLASRLEVSLDELQHRVVISFPPECPQVWRDFWAVDPRPDGSPVKYGPVVRDVESLLATIAHGKAIAFQPAAARRFFPRPGIAFVDVTDLPPCTSALAWHEANRERPNVLAVRQAARAAYPNLP